MKVSFGEFPFGAEAQPLIRDIFEKVNSPKYTELYVAYPHLLPSQEHEPSDKNSKRFEIYIFSLPKLEDGVYTSPMTKMTLNGQHFTMREGQRDVINAQVPSGYEILQDENGQTIGIYRDNKLWLTTDALHIIDNQFITQLFYYISDQLIVPLDPEGKAKRLEAMLLKSIKKILDDRFKDIKAGLESKERAVTTAQAAYQTNLREYLSTLSMYNSLEKVDDSKAKSIVGKLMSIPFVEEVNARGETLILKTKPITLGPFNYGRWTFEMGQGGASLFSHDAGDVLHPYEYNDRGHFCLGGFTDNYMNLMFNGDFTSAAGLLRLLLTNYSVSTRMHDLEPFLRKVMGTANFNKLLAKLAESADIDTDNYNVQITSINGLEMNLQANRKAEALKGELTIKKMVKL
jgi:hypothetical protein